MSFFNENLFPYPLLETLQNIKKLSCYFLYGIIGNPTSAWGERVPSKIFIKGPFDFFQHHHRLFFFPVPSSWINTRENWGRKVRASFFETVLEYSKTGCSSKQQWSPWHGWKPTALRAREVRQRQPDGHPPPRHHPPAADRNPSPMRKKSGDGKAW